MKKSKSIKTTPARHHRHHRKRHGKHQRRTKDFHKAYLPYLPLAISIIASMIISGWLPQGNTLAYATNTSVGGLLAATNNRRADNGVSALSLNQLLINAAQAKANDMVERDYWSHNTPDGQEPWVFVDNAGYKYLKAGENLAYGFLDSDSTVTGWMNSASHRANMLDTAFTEVGFGYANSSNYNESGPETVVVAMYGKPQALGAKSPEPAPSEPQPKAAPAAKPAETTNAKPQEVSPVEKEEEDSPAFVAFTTNTPGLSPVTAKVTRIQTIAGAQSSWAVFAVGLMVGLAVMAGLMKHGLALKRLVTNSEQFVLHHPVFDSTVIGLIVIGVTLLQTTGFTL